MMEEANHHSQLDRQLLQNGPITLYFKRHILEETVEWFCQQNYEVVQFDCREWKSQEEASLHL